MKKQKAEIIERKHYLDNLHNFLELMEQAIGNDDLDRYEKMERDFRHVTEQLDYVGKRSI